MHRISIIRPGICECRKTVECMDIAEGRNLGYIENGNGVGDSARSVSGRSFNFQPSYGCPMRKHYGSILSSTQVV